MRRLPACKNTDSHAYLVEVNNAEGIFRDSKVTTAVRMGTRFWGCIRL